MRVPLPSRSESDVQYGILDIPTGGSFPKWGIRGILRLVSPVGYDSGNSNGRLSELLLALF